MNLTAARDLDQAEREYLTDARANYQDGSFQGRRDIKTLHALAELTAAFVLRAEELASDLGCGEPDHKPQWDLRDLISEQLDGHMSPAAWCVYSSALHARDTAPAKVDAPNAPCAA